MKISNGKTAFITGGASGIGYATAQAFLQQGMNVMIADINESALNNARSALNADNGQLDTVICDVSDLNAVEQAAQKTIERFGNVHVLFNNAGVFMVGAADQIRQQDWDWCVSINQWGVINGIKAFLPHMREHREQSHIINTASMGGLFGTGALSAYCTTKFAVVGISECLREEFSDTQIGVSVLCPLGVKTNLSSHSRTTDKQIREGFNQLMDTGIAPSLVAERIIECVEEEEFYIFTHPDDSWAALELRFNEMKQAVESAGKSAALQQ